MRGWSKRVREWLRSQRPRAGRPKRDYRRPFRAGIEPLEDRTLLSTTTLAPLAPGAVVTDHLSASDETIVRSITLNQPGLLVLTVHATDPARLDTRLSLRTADGGLLIQSDGQSPTNPDDLIAQHLAAGTYFVAVEGLGGAVGQYTLSVQFQAASIPFQQVPLGTEPVAVTLADVNRDGNLDVITANTITNDVAILLGVGDGTLQVPVQRLNLGGPAGSGPAALLVTDINRDGLLDIVTAKVGNTTGPAKPGSITIALGKGDGTFQTPLQGPAIGAGVDALVSGDFNGDGFLDLATANASDNSVSVVFGNGDGTFQSVVTRLAVGTAPHGLAVGDFDRDGYLDLATANTETRDISLLFGNPGGTFTVATSLAVGPRVSSITAADVNGDGFVDLLTADNNAYTDTSQYIYETSPTVSLFLGIGDRSFGPRQPLTAGRQPILVQAADVNNDGKLDLLTANQFSNDVSVLRGEGDGTFAPQQVFNVGLVLAGQYPGAIALGDLNHDGILDLVTANRGPAGGNVPKSISVLLGVGDGTFEENRGFAVGDAPNAAVTADLNNDGRQDLVVANVGSNDVSVLLGLEDGTFEPQRRFRVGVDPNQVLVGDFNGDQRPDLVVTDTTSGGISILLGVGDGTFLPEQRVVSGAGAFVMALGDLNGDGNLDIAVANRTGNTVSVMLGRGDGAFTTLAPIAVGRAPATITLVDINTDGLLDIVTSNLTDGTVSVLLGQRDGPAPGQWHLAPVRSFAAGASATGAIIQDVNGDHLPDVIVANKNAVSTVSLLLGTMQGGVWALAAPQAYAVTRIPDSVATGDFNGDGRLDLVVTDTNASLTTSPLVSEVSILLGQDPTPANGQRFFQSQIRIPVAGPVLSPASVVVADFNDDGFQDLVVATQNSSQVSVLLGKGDGTFSPAVQYAVTAGPRNLIVADFNADGRLDIASSNKFSDDVSVLLNTGNGTFVPANSIANPIQSTPLLADLGRDKVPDEVVLAADGQILVRAGTPGTPGQFDPPRVVNPDPLYAARDVAVVNTPTDTILAALDSSDRMLALYTRRPDGAFTRTTVGQIPGSLPVHLVSGDLNGDGLSDLVVAAAGSSSVLVYIQQSDGRFDPVPQYTVNVGVNPARIRLADVDGDRRPDIVVTDQYSGDVSVALNQAAQPFAAASRFRAGSGLYADASFGGTEVVHSLQGTDGLAVADLTGDGIPDLLVTNASRDRLQLLRGDGHGGFLNPGPADEFITSANPIGVVTGYFNGDKYLDIAVLSQDDAQITVYAGDGAGGFRVCYVTSAGNVPTGLSAADVNRDGHTDLLVGNAFGDILALTGVGDGTFLPYQRSERTVSLAVTDLNGDGIDDYVLANESLDRVTVEYSHTKSTQSRGTNTGVVGDRASGLLAPSAVVSRDLNDDGIPDLAVANSGGNEVLVYLGTSNGQFESAKHFFTGTTPVGLTVQDLNGDGLLDLLVANEGSNDVSVLLAQGHADTTGLYPDWTLTYGPRLNAGFDPTLHEQVGLGPTATALADLNGDGRPDLLVTDSLSNNVAVLPGKGNGFFDDAAPRFFSVGADPTTLLLGHFDGRPGLDLITTNAGSNSLTLISGIDGADPISREIASGGIGPTNAITGDFNHDGLSDLIVAHNGNGLFSLFFGEADGPHLAELLAAANLPHPSDLALAAARNGGIDIFATGDGQDAVFRLTFDLTAHPDVDLVSTKAAQLALVAAMLAGGRDQPGGSAEPGQAEDAVLNQFVIGLGSFPGSSPARTVSERDELNEHPSPESAAWRALLERVHAEWLPHAENLLSDGLAIQGPADVALGVSSTIRAAFDSMGSAADGIPSGSAFYSIFGRVLRDILGPAGQGANQTGPLSEDEEPSPAAGPSAEAPAQQNDVPGAEFARTDGTPWTESSFIEPEFAFVVFVAFGRIEPIRSETDRVPQRNKAQRPGPSCQD